MFRLWLMGEASWAHNRVHVLLAALSLVLAFGTGSAHAGITAVVIVGTLLLRILLWDRNRRGTPLLARVSSRRQR